MADVLEQKGPTTGAKVTFLDDGATAKLPDRKTCSPRSKRSSSLKESTHPRENHKAVYTIFSLWVFAEIFINYDSGAIPVALDEFQKEFGLSETLLGILGALPYVGLIVGSPISGVLLQMVSQKLLIIITLMANVMFTAMLAGAMNTPVLFIARFLIGLTQSTACIYIPVWVDEFAPDKHITAFMGFVQGGAVVGVMVGYLVTGYSSSWRYSLILPSLVLITMWLIVLATPATYINLYKEAGFIDPVNVSMQDPELPGSLNAAGSGNLRTTGEEKRRLMIDDYAAHTERASKIGSHAYDLESADTAPGTLDQMKLLDQDSHPFGGTTKGNIRRTADTVAGGALLAGLGHGVALDQEDIGLVRREMTRRASGRYGDVTAAAATGRSFLLRDLSRFQSRGDNVFEHRTRRGQTGRSCRDDSFVRAPTLVIPSPAGATFGGLNIAAQFESERVTDALVREITRTEYSKVAGEQPRSVLKSSTTTGPSPRTMRKGISSGGVLWGGVDEISPVSTAMDSPVRTDPGPHPIWAAARRIAVLLFGCKIYIWTVFTLCALLFVVTGIQYWSTKYFVNEKGVPPSKVLLWFSGTAASAPTLGVFIGSFVVDHLGGYRTPEGLVRSLWFCLANGLCATVAGFIASLLDSFLLIIACMWFLLFFGAMVLPPATGILISSVHPDVRSTASSFSMLAYNTFGYSLGTFLPGPFITHFGLGTGMKIIFYWAFFGMLGVSMTLIFAIQAKNKAALLVPEENESEGESGDKGVAERMGPNKSLSTVAHLVTTNSSPIEKATTASRSNEMPIAVGTKLPIRSQQDMPVIGATEHVEATEPSSLNGSYAVIELGDSKTYSV